MQTVLRKWIAPALLVLAALLALPALALSQLAGLATAGHDS